ncbi:hypothetical protein GGI07_000963 [Coemansia sp. Benny D115]|nr:hypothetical protein GGI07_000963 [Coemansia sp. Benny D115]
MQFYLDEDTVPIRLYTTGNAPSPDHRHYLQPHHHHPGAHMQVHPPHSPSSFHHAPAAFHQEPLQRSVPGHPYIRFVSDDDLDGGYPFDAFQDLRTAYCTSPLAEIQARMRSLQQQQAQIQLQRALLERQLREQEERERELQLYQRRLEEQRRQHAQMAADRARKAYLARLHEEERQRQLMEERRAKSIQDGGFHPPIHFFDHILNSQLKSQDSIERKKAEKSALEELLETYFGDDQRKRLAQTRSAERDSRKALDSKNPSMSPSSSRSSPSHEAEPSAAATTDGALAQQQEFAGNENPAIAVPTRSLPPFGVRSAQIEPSVLDSVLRVVHDRLGEIAALEEREHREKSASPGPASASAPSTPAEPAVPAEKVNVDVIEESPSADSNTQMQSPEPAGAEDKQQKGVEVEEPVDYTRLADTLRRRVSDLNDENTFLPLSPLLSSVEDEAKQDKPQQQESISSEALKPASAEPDLPTSRSPSASATGAMNVDENDENTDSEFAALMNDCKSQLRELQEASKKPKSEAAHRRRARNRRHRHHAKTDKTASDQTAKNNEVAATPDGSLTDLVSSTAAENPKAEGESLEQRQKRAVRTIEDYILGVQKTRKAKNILESLRTLRQIDEELEGVRKDYNWRLQNMHLSFVSDGSGNLRLAYNGDNKEFHEYQEILQRLLLKLDAVPSYGDLAVRDKRKLIVKRIQATLDALDRFAAEQESELSEAGLLDSGSAADESSNGDEWM